MRKMSCLLVALSVKGMSASIEYQPFLNTAVNAARAAGDIMTRRLGAEVMKTKFNPRDLLTEGLICLLNSRASSPRAS